MLNEVAARRIVTAWARKVRADLNDLKQGEGGDFFGQLGSLCFDYFTGTGIIVVRAYIFPYSNSFTSKDDLLPWLNQIAAEDPDSVSHGTFEVTRPRWEPDKESSLFLRIEMDDGSLPEPAVISRLVKLRDDSMVWRRAKLTKALDGLVRKRRQEREPL